MTEYPLETPDSLPGSIVARDGALYFTEGNTNVVSRMNTAGKVTRRYPLPTVERGPDRARDDAPGAVRRRALGERARPAQPVGLVRPRGADEEQPRRDHPRPRRQPLVHVRREQDRPAQARPLSVRRGARSGGRLAVAQARRSGSSRPGRGPRHRRARSRDRAARAPLGAAVERMPAGQVVVRPLAGAGRAASPSS